MLDIEDRVVKIGKISDHLEFKLLRGKQITSQYTR